MKMFRGILLLAALCGAGSFLLWRGNAKPRIEINKAQRELRLFRGNRLVRTYPVALGFDPVSTKRVEGDGATPEGEYSICVRNPRSRFFLSLGISYPGPHDAERGFRDGLISEAERDAILRAAREGAAPPWKTKLGGEIFIHGNGSCADWTLGCIALADDDMAELYDAIPIGTRVTINP